MRIEIAGFVIESRKAAQKSAIDETRPVKVVQEGVNSWRVVYADN